MRLSKLEIKGFKSFGDRVVINFDEGITGIVGPNGCGKSNVVDAIRWVLGEQKTRILRSESMEGVVFNGTSTRKPSQMAEVSMTFDNTKNILSTEYTQVTVTRKYYRTGDSEYLLNNIPCRLKDITSLFLDTGIGPDSYAIIELKMVEGILDDKGNSRRNLFEEAAGVSRFKIRKKETLGKLQDTDENLERLEDVLFEINKNLKSLEKQAKQAETWQILNQEKKNYGISLAKKTSESLKENLQHITQQLTAQQDQKLNITAQITLLESKLQDHKSQYLTKEKLLASRQNTLNEHSNKIRKFESDKKISNERLRYLNDRQTSLKELIDQDRKIVERTEFSLRSLSEESQAAKQILAERELQSLGLKQALEQQQTIARDLQNQLSAENAKYRVDQEKVNKYNRTIEINSFQIEGIERELSQSSSSDLEHSASLNDFGFKIDQLEKGILTTRQELEMAETFERDLEKRVEEVQITIEKLRDDINQSHRSLDAKQNEFQLTKSLVDNLEGFPEAIKFLKKNATWAKDAPLLSDVLSCPEAYRLAIESYLEPWMNHYVVETEEYAFQAVNLLSNSSKGKANFFVLDRFDRVRDTPPSFKVGYTPAIEIVECDAKYKQLISHLLFNVFVIENNQFSIPDEEDFVYITKNAQLVSKKRSLSGGSVGLFEGKRIGRAKNLDKLQESIKQISSELSGKKGTLDKLHNELNQIKTTSKKPDIERLTKVLNQTMQEQAGLKARQEQFEQLLKSNKGKRENLEEQLTKLNAEQIQLKPLAEEASFLLVELEQRIKHIQAEFDSQSEHLKENSNRFNEANILKIQQENKVKSLEQEIGYKNNTMDSAKERLHKNEEELTKTDSDVRNLLQTDLISEDELLQLYEERVNIEAGVREAEQDYFMTRGEIDKLDKEIREQQRRSDDLNMLVIEFQGKINETKFNIQSIFDRVSIEFGVSEEELLENKSPIEASLEEIRTKTEEVRQKIEKLGPVNPMAKEAYDEIKNRHDFILTQKQDLVKAKESLLETISEIDEVAKATFINSFEKIKTHFVRVFQSLFEEGDTCDLVLADLNDPLESSIEIIAKPKGKRPQTINQLSGGEKTLTATALLFSIYLLKPAPFCIFDEVDAPLDDNNIDKFNNIIKQFSKESQFIIVTHNKRTMLKTDVIYGVTMPEKGVSKLVPVDLRQLDAVLEN